MFQLSIWCLKRLIDYWPPLNVYIYNPVIIFITVIRRLKNNK